MGRLEENNKSKLVPGRIVVSMEEMSGTGGIIAWARRGPGHTAKTSTSMSHRILSSITERLVLSVAKRIQLQSLRRGAGSPSNQEPSEKGFTSISLIFAS
jgi:hypothetical protein